MKGRRKKLKRKKKRERKFGNFFLLFLNFLLFDINSELFLTTRQILFNVYWLKNSNHFLDTTLWFFFFFFFKFINFEMTGNLRGWEREKDDDEKKVDWNFQIWKKKRKGNGSKIQTHIIWQFVTYAMCVLLLHCGTANSHKFK